MDIEDSVKGEGRVRREVGMKRVEGWREGRRESVESVVFGSRNRLEKRIWRAIRKLGEILKMREKQKQRASE